jgi:hypothetical protein
MTAMIKILLTIALLAVPALSQSFKELGYIQKPGEDVGIVYSVDSGSIQRTKDSVRFVGRVQAYYGEFKTKTLITTHKVESVFTANCTTFIWSEPIRKGVWGEKVIDDKNLVTDRQAIKEDPIFSALTYACGFQSPPLPKLST